MEEDSESDSPGPSSPKKRRRAITDVQRKDLRVHGQLLIQKTGKWSTDEMVHFFYKKYDRVLAKSTVSEILSDKFKHLDEQDQPLNPENKRRHQRRTSKLYVLESALFDWEQRMLKENGTITDDLLKSTAKRLFNVLHQYHNLEPPAFGWYWLEGYKARWKDERNKIDNELDTGDPVDTENQFEDLRKGLEMFDCEEIYTMDETALFWKRRPDDALASKSIAGSKPEKARITAILACNVTSTHKLLPWFIGKARVPRCFDSSGVQLENFPLVWRYNGQASLTGSMLMEYFRWFDEQMAGRPVCLLVDELSAHSTGISFLHAEFPEGLTNTTILFLPTNTKSSCQPLDQGITRSWKTLYRGRWLTYMCDEYNANRNPIKSMNVLQAVRWGMAAWEDITPTTIKNSWFKSRVLGSKYNFQTLSWDNYVYKDNRILDDITAGMERRIKSLIQQRRIKSAMDIAAFVNPADEIVDDNDENFFESLAEAYSTGGVERDRETDEEDVAVAPIEESEALELLARLRLYEEQQEVGDAALITRLNKYEKEIRARLAG